MWTRWEVAAIGWGLLVLGLAGLGVAIDLGYALVAAGVAALVFKRPAARLATWLLMRSMNRAMGAMAQKVGGKR